VVRYSATVDVDPGAGADPDPEPPDGSAPPEAADDAWAAGARLGAGPASVTFVPPPAHATARNIVDTTTARRFIALSLFLT